VRHSEYTLPADMVVKALGQEVHRDLLRAIPGVKLTADGRVVVDPATGATSAAGLFAGGDCQKDAGEEIVNAVEAGKTAARGIHKMMMNGG
jgi:NADPH-dependent glutamate synthase beta subunit-like oxidoreductase